MFQAELQILEKPVEHLMEIFVLFSTKTEVYTNTMVLYRTFFKFTFEVNVYWKEASSKDNGSQCLF